MQRNTRGAQLAVLAVAVLFLAIGAAQGNRLDHMREAERFYRWVVSAATSAMSVETLEGEKAAGTDPQDDELFAEIEALAEQTLPELPVEDVDRNALGEPRSKLVRAVRQENDRAVYDLLSGAQGKPLMAKYAGYLRENKLISVGTQFTANDMYGGDTQGIGLTSLFFGFRKLAANFLWLNVDTAWHAGQMHRMVPMMRTTVTLDPNFIDAYLLGAWHLAYNLTAKLPETPEPLKEFHPKYKRRLGVKEVWYYVAADFLKDGIKKNPREYKLYFDLGYAVYESKLNDHANAVRYLKEARRYKHDQWVPRMLYYSMWRNGQYDEALAGWQEYAQQFPTATQWQRFIPINKGYLAETKSDQAAECADAARIASAEFTRQAGELDTKGDAAGAADLRAKAADADKVVAEMDAMSAAEWQTAKGIFERMKEDSVASYRLQRRIALDLARQGRASEAVAYLDVARNQYLEAFDEISDLMIDIKLKAGLPLLVTEKYALERRREAAAYAPQDVPKPKRFVECAYALPEKPIDVLPGAGDVPDPSALTLRERFLPAAAVATIVIAPSLYSFQFMSFSHAKLAGVALGSAVLACVVPPERVWDRARVRLFAPLLLLLIWAGAIAAWTGGAFFQSAGLTAGASYFVMMLAALVLLGAAPAITIQRAVAISSIPVAVLALGQYAVFLPRMFPVFSEYDQRMYSVFGNQDLLGGYLAIGLALGLALWFANALNRWMAVAIFVSAFPALLLSGSRSAWLAAVVGAGIAAGIVAGQDRAARGKLAAFGACAAVTMGLVALLAPQAMWARLAGSFAADDAGYRIRLWIWDGTLHLIGQHPITGVGLGDYAYRSPLALGQVLQLRGPGVHMFNHTHTQHAHSDLFEIAAEAGLVGVALLAAFLFLIPRRRSAAWAGLAAAFTFSLINTTLHAPPHVLAVLLLAGSLAEAKPLSGGRTAGAIERGVQGVVLALAMLGLAYAALQPSWHYARAQALYDAGNFAGAEGAYRAAAYLPGNHAAASEYAVLLANQRRPREAMAALDYAARGLDTGDLWYVRAVLTEQDQPLRLAAAMFRECLRRWPDHRLAHEGVVRNSGPGEREALLAEAKRWLSPEDYAVVTEQPSAPR